MPVLVGRRRAHGHGLVLHLILRHEEPPAVERQLRAAFGQRGEPLRSVLRTLLHALLLLLPGVHATVILGALHTFEEVGGQRAHLKVVILGVNPAAAESHAARRREAGVLVLNVYQRLFAVADEHADAAAAHLHAQPVPLAGHGMKAQLAHAKELVKPHVASAHEVKVVLKAALDAHHVAVEAVIRAEAGPNLHLLRRLRGACAEGKLVVLPPVIAEHGIRIAGAEHAVGHGARARTRYGKPRRRV